MYRSSLLQTGWFWLTQESGPAGHLASREMSVILYAWSLYYYTLHVFWGCDVIDLLVQAIVSTKTYSTYALTAVAYIMRHVWLYWGERSEPHTCGENVYMFIYMVHAYSIYTFCPICVRFPHCTLIGSCS